ncbi:glycosyltransferase [Ornithinimicrobium sp. Arc0846-15]|nr:glycosyltransferase [Ornithinimicrobium laminariae]
MRVALLGPSRHPVVEPYAGGQESYVATLARGLRERDHRVTLFAAPGSDPDLADELVEHPVLPDLSPVAAIDPQLPEPGFLRDQNAFLAVTSELMRRRADFDVVHNNSLHHLPLMSAEAVDLPLVTTLHTPPFPWMELGIALCKPRASFVAVSASLAAQWTSLSQLAVVIPSGVSGATFATGNGGPDAVWVGRMVPEKGADLAVAAARHANRPLRLIGPIGDPAWFTARLQPLLGGNVHYEGHLSQNQTANVVGSAGLLLMTPRWDEPFGLVAVESALTGTPVLALRRGGLAEVLDEHMGVLVSPGVTDEATSLALAAQVDSTAAMPRAEVRASAMQRFSVAAMVAAYEDIYRKTIAEW